jgi:hypothetical protein
MDQLLRGIGKPHDFAVAEKGGAKKSLSMKKNHVGQVYDDRTHNLGNTSARRSSRGG